jgi:uncharacterized membrane protein
MINLYWFTALFSWNDTAALQVSYNELQKRSLNELLYNQYLYNFFYLNLNYFPRALNIPNLFIVN